MDSESCHVSTAASHLKKCVLGLRVSLGDDVLSLLDSGLNMVLCGSDGDGEEDDSEEVMVVIAKR
jgi:hypothetical protein